VRVHRKVADLAVHAERVLQVSRLEVPGPDCALVVHTHENSVARVAAQACDR
jgi:hypothetical protein